MRPTTAGTTDRPSGTPLCAVVHSWMAQTLGPGGKAIDATCGRGRDTLALARAVGPTGRVMALDCQEEAVLSTRLALEAAGASTWVKVHEGRHEDLLRQWARSEGETCDLVHFNLGYLPGSDRSLKTERESTLIALASAWDLVKSGGWISVVCYRGHHGGPAEAEAVAAWVASIETDAAVEHFASSPNPLSPAWWRMRKHSHPLPDVWNEPGEGREVQ